MKFLKFNFSCKTLLQPQEKKHNRFHQCMNKLLSRHTVASATHFSIEQCSSKLENSLTTDKRTSFAANERQIFVHENNRKELFILPFSHNHIIHLSPVHHSTNNKVILFMVKMTNNNFLWRWHLCINFLNSVITLVLIIIFDIFILFQLIITLHPIIIIIDRKEKCNTLRDVNDSLFTYIIVKI